MFVTWITFGYKDWNSIHKELGRQASVCVVYTLSLLSAIICRLFKTRAFNRDMRVRGEGV